MLNLRTFLARRGAAAWLFWILAALSFFLPAIASGAYAKGDAVRLTPLARLELPDLPAGAGTIAAEVEDFSTSIRVRWGNTYATVQYRHVEPDNGARPMLSAIEAATLLRDASNGAWARLKVPAQTPEAMTPWLITSADPQTIILLWVLGDYSSPPEQKGRLAEAARVLMELAATRVRGPIIVSPQVMP